MSKTPEQTLSGCQRDNRVTDGNWESRWHPLLQQWIVIAAGSALRPWSGTVINSGDGEKSEHDPECYLCPGVVRANGQINPDYHGPWAFDNDFPSLALNAPDPEPNTNPSPNSNNNPLHQRQSAVGICRVMCWSEKHNTTLSDLPPSGMREVVQLWKDEYSTLSQHPQIKHVLIFENKGKEIGVSNLHPHGQIYATGFVTDNATRMRQAQHHYQIDNPGKSLLQDLLGRVEYQHTLLIDENQHFKTIVPFAARMPFETWIVPTRHISSIDQLSNAELDSLAQLYQRQAKRYDVLFQRSAPNVTLLHNAPCDDSTANSGWCFHIDMQPPLRESNKLKYLAGFETGSNNVINPVQPEAAAAALRACLLPGEQY